ncbi:MAG TPA: alpha/beta hydrolase [Vicinamibacterales bacterium]|nr:alpha/beta hydrolase [Vicinamibacterales bacterium]
MAERLRPCPSERGLSDAYCGTLSVFEDRTARAGRRIDLNLVVLPAATETPQSDPLFFLAGGPGQGAADMAELVGRLLDKVRRQRDLVLVDQRGTGKSNPLDCPAGSDSLQEVFASEEASIRRVRSCLESLQGDVRLYTTSIAMDDLDEVRSYLGYDRISLYGASYGTRAALVYLRRHGARVRSIVLDGVVPTGMRLPLFTARDAERALNQLLADCDASRRCRETYPGLPTRIRTLLSRLTASPVRTRLVHPRTGVAETVDVTAQSVAGMIFGALYSPATAALLPMLIDDASRNDFQALVALALAGDAPESISVGMQLSVLCSEDAPRISAADVEREAAGTIFGGYLAVDQLTSCESWPRGAVDPDYYEPIESDVPALILSGDIDPVTPASWGDIVAQHLSRSRHLIAPGTGHGVIGTPCGTRLIAEFIDRGSADGLDATCLQSLKRPPFFLTLAGPDPVPAPR